MNPHVRYRPNLGRRYRVYTYAAGGAPRLRIDTLADSLDGIWQFTMDAVAGPEECCRLIKEIEEHIGEKVAQSWNAPAGHPFYFLADNEVSSIRWCDGEKWVGPEYRRV